VNNKQRKTLQAIFAQPVSGTLEWLRIEALLLAIGCNMLEGNGSQVTFEHGGQRLHLHRPHPGKEALRYRVIAVRNFLQLIGVRP